MTLPLTGEKEDPRVGNSSVNSTPASDTFYTATSVLSPDPRDLTSPLSPLPLDVPHTEYVKEKEELSQGGHGAFVNEKSDCILKVPRDNYLRDDLSQFKKKDSSTALHKHPTTSQGRNLTISPNCENKEHLTTSVRKYTTEVPRTPDCDSAVNKDNLAAFLTSPILLVEGDRVQQGSPVVGTATSTPIKVAGAHGFRKASLDLASPSDMGDKKDILTSYSYKASGNESSFEVYSAPSQSGSSDANVPSPCVDNNNRHLDNNNRCGNGNVEVQSPVNINQKSEQSEESSSSEDKGVVNREYEKSSVWHSGLEDVCESSALISPEAEVAKASKVLMKLREGSDRSDTSVDEQVNVMCVTL